MPLASTRRQRASSGARSKRSHTTESPADVSPLGPRSHSLRSIRHAPRAHAPCTVCHAHCHAHASKGAALIDRLSTPTAMPSATRAQPGRRRTGARATRRPNSARLLAARLRPQGAALRLFTAVARAVHTCFTAVYGAVNQRNEETKLTTMAQNERPVGKSINRRPSPESRQHNIT